MLTAVVFINTRCHYVGSIVLSSCACTGSEPCHPQFVSDRILHLTAAYKEMLKLANERQSRIKEACRMWQFCDDVEDEEAWIKEKEHMMSSPDLGHDLTSIRLLLTKHKVSYLVRFYAYQL